MNGGSYTIDNAQRLDENKSPDTTALHQGDDRVWNKPVFVGLGLRTTKTGKHSSISAMA